MPKNERTFAVLLRRKRIASLHQRDDYTWLTFDPEYLADPSREVLGLRFEEAPEARHRANMRLPPWFSNLLPEGILREWIASAQGVPATREMELLARVGGDLPGAVQVLETEESAATHAGARREIVADPPKNEGSVLWRFSLAGVALKFSMLGRGKGFVAPATGEGGDWIVKLPYADHPAVPLNEFAMMRLASAVGIEVPEHRLIHRDLVESLPERAWPRGESYAYAVRRFDRGNNRELIHIEDLAQVRGLYPEDKYLGSFETVASLIYRRRDAKSLAELVRRLAFNI